MDNGQMLLTERQTYERLGIGRSTLRRLMGVGAIRPVRIGRAVRFPVAELETFVQRLQLQEER